MNIQEAILNVIIEHEEESITDANNFTADAFSPAYISQRENLDEIFTSEMLDKLDDIVDVINNLTINDVRYELNKAIASESQDNIMSDLDTLTHTSNSPDPVTHTSNGIVDQQLLRGRTIRKISVFPPPE